jgi:hypothetical protein
MILEECSIIQITSAVGWKAVYEDVDSEKESLHAYSLACWALVETPDGERFVTGLEAEPGSANGFVAGLDNFCGYYTPDGEHIEGTAPVFE